MDIAIKCIFLLVVGICTGISGKFFYEVHKEEKEHRLKTKIYSQVSDYFSNSMSLQNIRDSIRQLENKTNIIEAEVFNSKNETK